MPQTSTTFCPLSHPTQESTTVSTILHMANLTQLCPNRKEAIGWYQDEKCMLRYSDRDIFGRNETGPAYYMWNMNNATNADKFNGVVKNLLDTLRSKAALGDSRRKYGEGNAVVPSNKTVPRCYLRYETNFLFYDPSTQPPLPSPSLTPSSPKADAPSSSPSLLPPPAPKNNDVPSPRSLPPLSPTPSSEGVKTSRTAVTTVGSEAQYNRENSVNL
ncbi:hypothetical protein PIB30_100996 [Stylosanthes scabra]|uniref:Uncharacterized protein n=1 Tax=Stylosanthes scabra TaxID=79078 RepID=A0ABU6WVL7_9FABA|nr:hypothetical protein [Stylosanthes scabra]